MVYMVVDDVGVDQVHPPTPPPAEATGSNLKRSYQTRSPHGDRHSRVKRPFRGNESGGGPTGPPSSPSDSSEVIDVQDFHDLGRAPEVAFGEERPTRPLPRRLLTPATLIPASTHEAPLILLDAIPEDPSERQPHPQAEGLLPSDPFLLVDYETSQGSGDPTDFPDPQNSTGSTTEGELFISSRFNFLLSESVEVARYLAAHGVPFTGVHAFYMQELISAITSASSHSVQSE